MILFGYGTRVIDYLSESHWTRCHTTHRSRWRVGTVRRWRHQMAKREKFRVGPIAGISVGVAMLVYFAIPMAGLGNSGRYELVSEILPWSAGLITGSLMVGLGVSGIIWFFGGSRKWQTCGFAMSHATILLLFVTLGLLANTMFKEQVGNPVPNSAAASVVDIEVDQQRIIADALWAAGEHYEDSGEYREAIRAMQASVQILPSDERQASLLAMEILFPEVADE